MSDTTTTETTTRTFTLTGAELADTRTEINKINRRAARRGLAGQIELTATEVTVGEETRAGVPVRKRMYRVTISGQPPKIGGWTLVGRVTWDEHAGALVHPAAGATVDESVLKEGWCEHCRTTRHRTRTYVLVNDAGRQVQVGSTCVNDFTGWEGRFVFHTEEDVAEVLERCSGSDQPAEWHVVDVLAFAYALVKAFGYKGSDTKSALLHLLEGRELEPRAMAAMAPYLPTADRKAQQIIDWIGSDAFGDRSDYARNLRAAAGAEWASVRVLGLLASAPHVWVKANEQAAAAAAAVNEWVGTVGGKATVEVEVVSVRTITRWFGYAERTTWLYTLEDADGRLFKWFASKPALGTEQDYENDDFDLGRVQITGTVKEHDQWQGRRQTVLTRCKVAIPAAAPAAA